MLILLYSYRRSGVWIEPGRVHVQFPGENQQEMEWSEARFAVNEGEEYLRNSKGKEGLGHIFGDSRYVRLHLEGLTPEQRAEAEATIAGYVEVRQPLLFTLLPFLHNKAQLLPPR